MSETTKHAGGRPPYQPTDKERAQVKTLAGLGIPHTDIARVMQIAEMKLRKYYSLELEVGSIEANAKVAKSLFDKATGPGKEGVTAAIFWLKARAGWRDGGEGGGVKARLAQEAQAAGQNSDWGDDLAPRAPLN